MRPPELSDVVFRPARDLAERDAGRRLQAEVYRLRGFVDGTPPGGMLDDPYVEIATYFVGIAAGEVVASARLIPGDVVTPPTLVSFDIDDRWRSVVDGVNVEAVAEIASLATDPRAPYPSFGVSAGLYRAMLHHSLSLAATGRHRQWIAAVEPALLRILSKIMRIPLDVIGAPGPYFGAIRTPIRIDLISGMNHVRRHEPEVWEYFQTGMVIDLTVLDEFEGATAGRVDGSEL